MPFSDPNAAAAANARNGLSNLASFLYEQQVTKPAVQAQTAATQAQTLGTQAQTAETQARTQMMGPQTDALRQEIIAQTLKNNSDRFSLFSQHPGINADAITAAGNGVPQDTDISTASPSPNAGFESPQVSTSTAGQGASGGQAGSSPSPTPNIPRNVNQAGSSTQGAPLPGKFPPDNNDYLAPSLTQSGTQPFRPAATPPVSIAPPVVAPVKAAAPVGDFDYRKELGTPFSALPAGAQTELLKQMRTPFVKAGLPVSDQELIGHYQQLQAQMIPNPMNNPELMLTGISDGKPNFVSRAALREFGGGGGNQGGASRIFDPTLGHYVDNPAWTKPAEVESTQSSLDSNTQAQKLLDSAKSALVADPSIVGPKILGQGAANLTRSGEAMVGRPANKTAEATLRRFQSGGFLTSLGGLKGVGRLDIPVVEAAKKGMPEQGDTLETWQNYLEQAQNALTQNRNALLQEYKQQTGGNGSLPPVDVAPGVSAPGASQAPAAGSALSPEQAKALPKGTRFLGQDGQYHIVR